jgi:hypothetical protein
MKNLSLAVATLAIALWANTSSADNWLNRQNVIRAANELAEGIEHLDTELHAVQAPNDLIQIVHHYEETITEFVDEVTRGISYQEASFEMNHIRQDYGLLRDKLYQYPQYLQRPAIAMEFRHVRSAYRALDHEMFRWDSARWTPERVQALEKEQAELKAYHDSK